MAVAYTQDPTQPGRGWIPVSEARVVTTIQYRDEEPAAEKQEPTPPPAETGNVAVDQANILASILNSPLYTESIKSAYLTQYLPGLTQANYEINKARAQEVQNSFLRQQAQAQAIRDVAGSYAARGMRTPKMVTEGFAPIQQATELETTAAQQAINDLIANKEVLYGAGATDSETFITDPTKFGSIGAGARRSALSELQQLPEMYGLTQVQTPSWAPGGNELPTDGNNDGTTPDAEAAAAEATKQRIARERAARERAAREQAAREKAAREQAAREQAAREKAAREAAKRDAAMAQRRTGRIQ